MVTIIIMEAFINKMRRLKGVRKTDGARRVLEGSHLRRTWLSYLRYMYKTVRKYYGEAIVVTQEVDDIISSPIVKESIINNADCKIYSTSASTCNKFDQIQTLLGLTDKERAQILSINLATNPRAVTRRYVSGSAACSRPSMPRKLGRGVSGAPVRGFDKCRCGKRLGVSL